MRETCHIFRKNGEDFVSFEVAKIRTKQALASTFHTLQETPEFSRSASEQHPGDLFSMSCYRLHVLYALNQGRRGPVFMPYQSGNQGKSTW